jgi:hypothetical protein
MAISSARMKNLVGDNIRPGGQASPEENNPRPAEITKGLVLSEIQFKPLDWFRYNPDNEIFRGLKSEDYFRNLKKDIAGADAIINPVIAMPDGLLIEGESRHAIARELYQSGNASFGKIPARIILSSISEDKVRERLYLGNLSRFDIPASTKILAYSQIWPDYFLEETDGSKGRGITTKKEIAEATGLSESQIKRYKAVVREAAGIAGKNNAPLSVEAVEEASKMRDKTRPPQSKDRWDIKLYRSFFRNKDPEYVDFAVKLIAFLNRNSFIADTNFNKLKELFAAVKKDNRP